MIKAIIFDQDGTLYEREHLLYQQIQKKTREWICSKKQLSETQYITLINQLKKDYPNPIKGFQSIGIAAHEYHQEVFDKVQPQHFLEPNRKLIQCLDSISIPMFVVTLSSKVFSHQVLYSLGIKKQFEQTYSLGGIDTTVQDKIHIYENIKSQLNLTSSEMVILGDNYAVDLEDAHKLGYQVFEVTNTPRLITILESLQEGAIQDEK